MGYLVLISEVALFCCYKGDSMKPISLYIHIPFCKSRCGYCDFLTFAGKEDLYEVYKNALVKEILSKRDSLKDYKVISIFIGGGTPTVLPSYFVAEILMALSTYNIVKEAEITIEANPGTLSLQMLRTLKNNGVNRISMGLQAWQNKVLKKIERGHKLEDFIKNYNNARRLNFKNINVDLIFSLPYIEKGSVGYWHQSLKNVVNLKPEHISIYSLILEEGTPFFKAYEDGILVPQSQEDDRRMYHHAIKYLSKKGYNHYEISNFSKKGKESLHNLVYWRRGEYMAFGLGASGFFNGERSRNITNLKEYINTVNSLNFISSKVIQETTKISDQEAMEEFMYLGLRCLEGVDANTFKETFKKDMHVVFKDAIADNVNKGLLQINGTKVSLTSMGLDISNVVMSDFLL
jgi:oxygen-independent coproporphyrinogen-3 oxidase